MRHLFHIDIDPLAHPLTRRLELEIAMPLVRPIPALLLLILCFALLPTTLLASPINPGLIHTDPTQIHMGVRWQVDGDTNRDATCQVRFRKVGTPQWRMGLDLVRTHPDLHGQAAVRQDNRFAGSLFFLETNTAYEIELTIDDPDGGGTQQVVTTATLGEMQAATDAVEVYAIPGSSGGSGSGSAADPYRGLQEACDHAQPGTIIHLAAGTYAPFELTTSGEADRPIVLRGPVDPHTTSDEATWAIIDGQDTDRGVFTLGRYDIKTGHIMIEDLVIQNGHWGVDAQNSHHTLMRRCRVRDVDFGYYNRRDKGWESHQMVMDSTFKGRTAWPGSGIPAERGIDLRGSANIVAHNRVQYFGDGVSVQPFTDASGYANDIYGNDIGYIVDDPIEIDYNSCNTRVWRNRVTNGRMGISLAPIYGGPVYIFRNQFLNLEYSYSAYKMNRDPAGLVIMHNTSIKLGNGTSSDSGWQNTVLRNNIIMGTRYVFEEYALVPGSVDDWDYDALHTSSSYFAKWDNLQYMSLEDLRQSKTIEAHAVGIHMDDMRAAALPDDYGEGVVAAEADLRLRAGAEAIDAGQAQDNINDIFVSDGKPDCGAYEYGAPLPLFGPRNAGGSDADSDGYLDTAQGGLDCDDGHAGIHPGALEICGDGIDQDCSGGDAACDEDDPPGEDPDPPVPGDEGEDNSSSNNNNGGGSSGGGCFVNRLIRSACEEMVQK